ncbi:MAG: hypothetical protein ACFE7R_08975 [Candidatus Hodarchaeota archaeon]
MNEDLDLKKLEQATFRVANQDGLTELFMGLMIVAIALMLWRSTYVYAVALVIIFQAAAIESIKERYTYPRIGRVKLADEYKAPSGYGWIVFAVVLMLALSSVIFSSIYEIALFEQIAFWAPLITGIVFIQVAAYLVGRSGLRRYYGLGIATAVLGTLFIFVDFLTPADRMILYIALVGAIFILTGFGSLIRFVRTYPLHEMEDVGFEQDQ